MMQPSTKNMIVRLIEETSLGSIKWRVEDVPRSIREGNDNHYPLFFQTDFKGKTVCLYEVKCKQFTDEHNFYWNGYLVIGVMDNAGRAVWDYWGNEKELRELFDDVRGSVEDVQQFLGYFS